MSAGSHDQPETPPPAVTASPGSALDREYRQSTYATPARLSLSRSGPVVPTQEQLRFQLDHALARDAVHTPLDVAALLRELARRDPGQAASPHEAGSPRNTESPPNAGSLQVWRHPLVLRSAVPARAGSQDRSAYLRRPDLGRRLHPESASDLSTYATQHQRSIAEARPTAAGGATAPGIPAGPVVRVVPILADGLSAQAVERHALPLLDALLPMLDRELAFGPLCIVNQARVAIGDEIGGLLGASLTVLLIGERPGLSAPDSLGVYLTWKPHPGRSDAERNCISNIHGEGLSYAAAAHRIAFYIREACRLQVSGIALKDPEPAAPRLS